VSRFQDEAHISSWDRVYPGNNENAGKKKNGKTRRGNNYLKAALTEAAWAAAMTRDTAFGAMYRNIDSRRGKRRALIAVGHHILIEVYRLLKTRERYQDAGAAAVTEQRLQNREQRMVRELERYRYDVSKVAA